MIPKLYDSTETQFGSGCICRLAECTYCEVTEEPNKIYECEFRYPITGKYYHEIQEERFICCTHDDKKDVQPFRIYKRSAPMNGIVTFYAHHLSYKASNVILEPHSVTTPAEFVAGVNSHSINNNPFTFTTTKSGTGSLEFDTPVSCRSALLDSKNSIVSTFGGEFEFDKWAIKHHAERGTKTDVTIRYGKNLMDIDQSISNESLYNAIVPYWSGKIEGVDVLIMPEDDKIVTLDGVTNPVPIAKDFSSEFKDAPEESDLIQAAKDFLESNQPWVPKENIKIDFIQLWQTDDYKDVASLQRVNLCDTLSVYYSELGVKAIDVKVVKTVYDTLNDRYSKMELGVLEGNFIQNAKENFDQQIYETAKGFESILAEEIEHATELLTNPGDSHVIFVGIDDEGNRIYGKGAVSNPQEILVMNTTDPATATEILRINKNGIGFANNINGPYRSAWTLDGHFIADFITAGTINGNLIRTGMLSDYSSTTFVLTSDTSIVAGKQYYIRKLVPNYSSDSLYSIGDLARYNGTVYKCTTAINETESWTSSHWVTATSSDYTYILVDTPMPVELGSYYEIQNTSHNYWNLETGEFRLSATTKVGSGNDTIAKSSDLDSFVVETDVEYGNSDSTSTPPTTWTTNAAWEKGKYLWTRMKMTLEDGTVQYSEARRIANDKGLGVSGVEEQYYLSTSNVTQTGGTWSSTQPTWVKDRYYWTRSKITWSDGSVTYTDPVLAQALTSGNQSTNDLDDSFTQQKIFNRLTNNGEIQGIYLENGKLYINATYIKSGYIESNRIKVTDFMAVQYGSSTGLVGKLGSGNFYKTKSGSYFICRGVGLSVDGTIENDYCHGVIALDFDDGGIHINAPYIEMTADRIDINGARGASGSQKVITNFSIDGDGNMNWTWNYINYASGLITSIS